MKIGDTINSNLIPAINSTALPSDKQDNANFYPALNSQEILDGQYLQFGSAPNVSLEEFPNVDKIYTAGQDMKAGKTAGIWGYITQTSEFLSAAQATWVRSDQADSNFDGQTLDTNELVKHGLISWSDLPAIPSGTGITVLTIKVTFKFNVSGGSPQQMLFDNNTATFDETTVTWNTKPTNDGSGLSYSFSSGSGIKTSTVAVAFTSTQYNNLKANGLTSFTQAAASAQIEDEDDNNPPKAQVEFIYTVQDGDAYLSSGLTTDQADGFRGIAQNDVVKGQEVVLRQEGIDDVHLTGLTAFADYELSDTPGEIQTGTGATSDKVIGNARSTTSFQIKYVLNDAT